ncbi:PAS domain S-box-containing protein [Natronincola peptidivorans]|uniref:HTH-type transcriptional regulatory protein TyrR n=1 Tax=Natronincola peptidivorans TaxID=426128 RepID=A0A1I0D7I4_9FIRM|nr:sigma 54-interacting transcriptional regulator [Natronincola peptidivorans]SET27477.1 PAS domain S-box-containing protein [Natronincola peptidivorans]
MKNSIEKLNFKLHKANQDIEMLNDIIENLSDGIYITDGEGNTLRVNSTYEKMSGLKKEELIGKNMKDLVKEGYFSESASIQVLKLKAAATVMYTVKTGKRLLAKGVPVFDEKGNIKLIVNNVWDLTEIYHLESQTLDKERITEKKEEDFIFHSKAMDQVVELALKASKVTSNILILGESGVGKDVIAKLIHDASSCKGGYIKINCAAIPEHLLESELFGYEEGSFTGAKKQGKPGMFELAEKGTIFLDEIAEIPIHLQAKLLRVIQEKEVIRVGGTKQISIDTRVIAATNRNLEEMVRKGSFREDLYYRLNVVPIKIPPLRHRKEDIIPLIDYFTNIFNKKYHLQKSFTKSTLEFFEKYHWKGNVRELQNIVERLIVVVDQEVITEEDVAEILNFKSKKVVTTDAAKLKDAVKQLEIQLIKEALKNYKSTRAAAKKLGIDQSTLVRKIKKYSLSYDAIKHRDDEEMHRSKPEL